MILSFFLLLGSLAAKKKWLHWIAYERMLYCDCKKMRAYFSSQWPNYIVEGENALDIFVREDAQQRNNFSDAEVKLLKDAANVVNNFDNPDIPAP